MCGVEPIALDPRPIRPALAFASDGDEDLGEVEVGVADPVEEDMSWVWD
jgi:hypothetical protein